MSKQETSKVTKSKKQEPLSEEQKRELAHFVEKINHMVPSEYQQAIFEKAKTQQGRYVINAGPGSGKTSTAIKASMYFTGRALYLAFNNKIMLDTHHKLMALGTKMTASTLHSFGLSCLQASTRGKCKVDKEKYDLIIDDYLRDQWEPFITSFDLQDIPPEQHPSPTDARLWSSQLLHYSQVTLTQPTEPGLHSLIEQFDLSEINPASLVWPFVRHLVPHALAEGIRQFQIYGTVNFDDMLYYPNVLKDVPVRAYKHIILDEAQDASKAGLGLLMRACTEQTQVFAIGDTRQSIYAFAGADIDSIPTIINTLQAETLPLRVCYRCGTSIIDLANQLDGQIIPAPEAHPGTVSVMKAEDYLRILQPKDVVLARTTKHLVKDCLAVLQTGRRARVLGKDLGTSIAAIVSRLEEMRIGRGKPALAEDLSNFGELLETYTTLRKKEIEERRNLKNKELALDELLDKVETVKCFYIAYINKCLDQSTINEHDPGCLYNHRAADFKYYIKALFIDDQDRNMILFMTAHRSKGGEWDRVFLIGTHEFPHPKAKSEKQHIQENNLMYVAITRAINELYFVEQPFSCLNVPGYEQVSEGLTFIVAPGHNHVELYLPEESEKEASRTRQPQDEHVMPAVTPPLALPAPEGETFQGKESEEEEMRRIEQLHKDLYPYDHKHLTLLLPSALHHDEIASTPEDLPEATAGKIIAIEVYCPTCNSICEHKRTKTTTITREHTGQSVICRSCGQELTVPINAFSNNASQVKASEKPTGKPYSKIEKKGRTPKERKSAAGRKTKSGIVRQPMQLSLDARTIETLNTMGINKSELFETLLHQYEPYLNAWRELGHEDHEEEGFSE